MSDKIKLRISIICAFLLLLILIFTPVYAENDFSSIYNEQVKNSGIDKIEQSLPKENRDELNEIGVDGSDLTSIQKITPKSFIKLIFGIFSEKTSQQLKSLGFSICVIMICACVNSACDNTTISNIINLVGTLSICCSIVESLSFCVVETSAVIKTATVISTVSAPVISSIMIASGKPATATVWQIMLTAAGGGIQLLAVKILVPAMRGFLAVSTVSALSPNLSLSGICNAFYKCIKWVLGFVVTIFTGLLTVKGMLSSSIDNAGVKTVRFFASSFVPVVGGAVSDAIKAISGSIGVLKGGVGALFLLAELIIFIPVVINILLWILTLMVASSISDLFMLKEISTLIHSCQLVMETLLAISITSWLILTVCGLMVNISLGGSS